MKPSFRSALLLASALLMSFGAIANACILVPDLHGDLIEIGVRPTVLGGTVLLLYFAAIAMFGFAVMVSAAAFQAIRGIAPARVPGARAPRHHRGDLHRLWSPGVLTGS